MTDIINLLDHKYDGKTYFETSQTTWPKTRRHVPEDVDLQFRVFLPSVFQQLYLHVKTYSTQNRKLSMLYSRTKFETEENSSTLVGNTNPVTIPSPPS